MIRRAESATAVSSVWLAKKTIAVSMIAKVRARNGAATSANSTAAAPSSRRASLIFVRTRRRAAIASLAPRDLIMGARSIAGERGVTPERHATSARERYIEHIDL